MTRLHDSEWLPDAERLPLGAGIKVKHSCGNSPSLSIRHSPGVLSAYCYRCKAWGRRALTHRPPKALREALGGPRQRSLSPCYVTLSWLPEHVQKAVYAFLASKGIDPAMLPSDVKYSPDLGRVAFRCPNGSWYARALHPDATPKWVQYGDPLGYYHTTPAGVSSVIILTEDILSAIKVQYSVKKFTVALLGITVQQALKVKLLELEPELVLIMLDGDAAGRDAAIKAQQELRFLGLKTLIVYTPEGADPKDLTIQRIRNLTWLTE